MQMYIFYHLAIVLVCVFHVFLVAEVEDGPGAPVFLILSGISVFF